MLLRHILNQIPHDQVEGVLCGHTEILAVYSNLKNNVICKQMYIFRRAVFLPGMSSAGLPKTVLAGDDSLMPYMPAGAKKIK